MWWLYILSGFAGLVIGWSACYAYNYHKWVNDWVKSLFNYHAGKNITNSKPTIKRFRF